MAPFAAGLQLYWVTNNILTIAQQKWLYSRHPAMKEPPPQRRRLLPRRRPVRARAECRARR